MFLYGWKLIPWSSHVYISSAGISCLVMTLDFAKALVKFKYTEQLPVVYAFMTLWVPGISVVFFLDRYKVVHGEKVRKLVYFPNKKTTYLPGLPNSWLSSVQQLAFLSHIDDHFPLCKLV
jgi:hypothetical protein